jgi:hypothetical protein
MKRACKVNCIQLVPTWREEHDYKRVPSVALKNYKHIKLSWQLRFGTQEKDYTLAHANNAMLNNHFK